MRRLPTYIPFIFVLCAVLTFLALGTWQVERLAWKNGLIDAIDAAQAQPVLEALPKDIIGLNYRNVHLTGAFAYTKALHMIAQQHGPEAGYSIVTPFKLNDGRIILVNRGFSPLPKIGTPENPQTIDGIIRPPRLKRTFAPENLAERNVWFYEDIPAMSAATGLALTPVIVEQTGEYQHNVYPIPADAHRRMSETLHNDHLGYAITWFSLAIIAITMYVFYRRKPKIIV